MDNKSEILNIFSEKFHSLREQEQKLFSKIVNKLLQVNYLTLQKTSDANDYRFVLLYKVLFSAFFQLIDFTLEIRRHDEVLFIRNIYNWNKLKLKKEESLILLIIRILFQQKKENLPSNARVEIYLQNIYKELYNIGFAQVTKLTKEKMKKTLILFRQYNIIDFPESLNDLTDDLVIKIYPSILYLIDIDMIKKYKELLTVKSY
ncbi:hypothetical protein C6B37_00660 [Candidatus Phytoplasma phoenicium]|uniref:DUF4194 domain-containing protein n=1 Tax=Candidatus Phytoplasma phoenicium TaxID=198422 RepID=A0A2S8NVA2_9MOLU|nr:hypothetical protein C6B37_00660 [Candidatus Phytoplasma phoenicium]